MKNKRFIPALLILSFFSFFTSGVNLYGAKKTVDPNEVLQKGRDAFLNYDFETAADLYDQYRTLKTKAKQPLDENFETWETQLEVAANSFERVQKIVIIDSISMPALSFFKAYRLPSSSGQIGPEAMLDNSKKNAGKEIGFLSEAGDYLISVERNKEGSLALFETLTLLDGSREKTETLKGDFDKSGNYAYPFMSADGQTLYFANDGEESMGGYDIFVAQRDPLTGEYRQPLNLGMPFNSPYDDFMLAIDEENGIGWWATDRNRNDGNVTIYVYLIDEIRKNYSPDEENLQELAMVSDYRQTWQPGREKFYKMKLSSLPENNEQKPAKEKEFEFPLGNGKTYYNYSDFRNKKAAEKMGEYIAKERALNEQIETLQSLRAQFKENKSLKGRILQMEDGIEKSREELQKARNEVLRLEKAVR